MVKKIKKKIKKPYVNASPYKIFGVKKNNPTMNSSKYEKDTQTIRKVGYWADSEGAE